MKNLTNKQGFSLIEVLLALALGALVLLSATSLVVSYCQIWLQQQEGDHFEDHIEGVAHFLSKHLQPNFGVQNAEEQVQWVFMPEKSGVEEPCLRFVLDESSPLLESAGPVPRPVVAYLSFCEKDGLVLFWHCPQEEQESFQKMKRVVISPFFRKAIFYYYHPQEKNWETTEDIKDPGKDDSPLPSFIQLKFSKDKRTESKMIWLKDPHATVFIY